MIDACFHSGSNAEAGFSAEQELVENVPAILCLGIREVILNSSPDLLVIEIPAEEARHI